MVSKGKIIGFIVVSLLCGFAIKLIGIVCKLFLGGSTIITLTLMGLTAIWIVKETGVWYLFPLTSLVTALISDVSSTKKFADIINGTASFYSFLDERIVEKVTELTEKLGDGFSMSLTAAAAIYNLADTVGMFLLTMLVSFIAKCILEKMGNNTIKNGGKENDQAHT